MTQPLRRLRVGVVGAGWMGHVHARAYARLRHHYPDLPVLPAVVAVADPVAAQLADFAARHGDVRTYPDWRAMLAREDVDVVSVTAPNAVHREVGAAVADAGRHLWIEKPVGLGLGDALAVRDAVARAGVQAVVGFNYRNAPAVVRAGQLLADGTVGRVTHARVTMLSDYAAHPDGALSWRFTAAEGGRGVLGDLGSHAVDLVRHLLGEVELVASDTAVLLPDRPVVSAGTSHYARGDAAAPRGPVENEDYVCALLRTAAGVRVTLECSRVAAGSQNRYALEVHGTRGFLAWDFRRMGELVVAAGGESSLGVPATRVLVGPGDGHYGRFHPGPGMSMSYDDLKVVECAAFVRSVFSGQPHGATLDDAVAAARVLEDV